MISSRSLLITLLCLAQLPQVLASDAAPFHATVTEAIQQALENWLRQQALAMLQIRTRFKVDHDSVETLRHIRQERGEYLSARHQPEPQP